MHTMSGPKDQSANESLSDCALQVGDGTSMLREHGVVAVDPALEDLRLAATLGDSCEDCGAPAVLALEQLAAPLRLLDELPVCAPVLGVASR